MQVSRLLPAPTLLAVLVVAALSTSALGAPREAAAAGRVAVDPEVVPRGERVAIRGGGWGAGTAVSLRIGPPASESFPIGVVRADDRGRFTKRVPMRGTPGLYVVTACAVGRCAKPRRALVRIVGPSSARTLLHTDLPRSRYLERPRRVGYRAAEGSTWLTRLSWRRWGSGKAFATGRARICEAGSCRRGTARISATRRVRYESEEWFYARVVVRVGKSQQRHVLCTLPAICGGRPGPP